MEFIDKKCMVKYQADDLFELAHSIEVIFLNE